MENELDGIMTESAPMTLVGHCVYISRILSYATPIQVFEGKRHANV